MRRSNWVKRLAALSLAGAVLLGAGTAFLAAESGWTDYDHLTVGTMTPFSGAFSTDLWGNNASDLDVRMLIHGYGLVAWQNEESRFAVDASVVSGMTVTENPAGDRTYLLTIYDNLYYSDGSLITARDYAFSILLSAAPQIREIGGSPREPEYLLGYEEYVRGEAQQLSGVRILGDYTLSLTIDHEYLPFFYEMALLDWTPYPIGVIAPGCVVRDDGQGAYIANEEETVEEPVFTAELLRDTLLDENHGYLTHPSVTSGPYRLVSFDGTTAGFTVNPYYKGNSEGVTPSIENLTYTTGTGEELIRGFEEGEIALVNRCTKASVLQEGVAAAAGSSHLTMASYARSGLSMFSFCCEKSPVSSVAVRQAIAHCLDREALTAQYVSNYGLRVDGYYGIGQWMYQLISPSTGHEEDENDWDALNLDDVPVYELNVEAAEGLLEEDGWVLNEEGGTFRPGVDTVRCRLTGESLTPLNLTVLVPEGSAVAELLPETFFDHLKEAGASAQMIQLPLEELLEVYYGQKERSCDMIYLASNFDVAFDPSEAYRPQTQEGAPNIHNTTRLNDEKLYELAVDMRRTEPGDTFSYCRKWIAFQERWGSLLPCIPVYSNVYMDFYPQTLQNYHISGSVSWAQAIVSAWLGDAGDEQTQTEEEEPGEDELVIID